MGAIISGIGLGSSLGALVQQLYFSFDTFAAQIVNFGQPYRPPQWSSANQATLVMLVPNTTTYGGASQPTLYVFDAILRAEHRSESVITLNPVQTGASIADHAYRLPSTLEVEIAMSDAMQSYIPGQWGDNPQGKSVSAYQTLLDLQASRSLVHISTRMNVYDNMLIQSVRTEEKPETRYGARIFVTFVEILNASVELTSSTITYGSSITSSARPYATDSVMGGTVQGQPVSQSLVNQFQVPSSFVASLPPVPGAGNWSSVNINTLANIV